MKKIKIDKNKSIETLTNEASEFKKFISRGNVVDMAVGVIVGGAFGKIVTSLVNDLLMPLIGVVIGGLNFSSLSFKVGESVIAYGNFIQSVIDFLIISGCIFLIIKFLGNFKKEEVTDKVEEAPKKSDEALLLEEIRDLLKKKK